VELQNETPLPAAHLASAHGDEMMTLLVACVTYDLDASALTLARDQLPLRLAPDSHEANDAAFVRSGVAVSASGFVYAPGGEAKEATAELRVGEASQRVRAFGVRVWGKGALGGLSATAPLPFDRVEMSWEHAYGGAVSRPNAVISHDGEELLVPAHDEGWVLNMFGTGYYADEKMAVDEPLPRLEDPDDLIKSWDHRPEPVCFAPYPLAGGLRAAHVIVDGGPSMERVPRVMGRSCPRGTFDDVAIGATVAVGGMRPRGEPLAFAMPEPPVAFLVKVGEVERRLVPRLDAVDLDAEAATARLVYRMTFSYPIVAHERRQARAVATPFLERVPVSPERADPAESPPEAKGGPDAP
jgi:hypothetical protein